MHLNQKITGFTLLEVMLSMTLLSIMMVLLFSSLRIAAESWDKGETKIAEVNEKAIVYQFFKRHIPTIRPLWDDFSDEDQRFSFQGEHDKLQFVTTFPVSAERKGLQLFTIKFDKAEVGLIKIAIQPFYPSLENEEWQQDDVVLLEHVETFEIQYFGKDVLDKKSTWFDSWKEKTLLPQMIKFKIVLADQSDWPDMIFALKLATMVAPSSMAMVK